VAQVKGKIEGDHSVILRNVRISARKARLIAALVRGMPVDKAIELTKRDEHRGAYFIHKLLRSALAGAMEKNMPEGLIVGVSRVDEGPTIKRFRPRAQGRATSIFKRTCHIIIGLRPSK